MSDKKNIDRLFQEKFRNFETSPDPEVWERIKLQKEENSKKRVLIPFWFRVAGVAALMVLLFTLAITMQNPTVDSENTILTTIESEKESKNSEPLVTIEKNSKEETEKIGNMTTDDPKIQTNSSQKNTNHIVSNDKSTEPSEKIAKKLAVPSTSENSNITTTRNSILRNKNSTPETSISSLQDQKQSTINNQQIVEQKQQKSYTALPDEQGIDSQSNTNSNNTTIANTPKNQKQNIKETSETEERQEEVATNLDSLENKQLLTGILKKEEEAVASSTRGPRKWKIAPTLAPIYYNHTGNGSAIDTEFSDNNTEGVVRMSYGIQVAYAVSDKIGIRTGINSVNMGYTVEDVGYTTSVIGRSLDHVSFNKNAEIIRITDFKENVTFARTPSSEFLQPQNRSDIQNRGALQQNMTYMEIPMELTYSILNKKMGIHLIGGFSTLLLQENQLLLDTGEATTDIGEINTMNPVSFSSNVGIGFSYQLIDQLQLSMEPILKYQFNSFEDTSGDFNPYYFGMYTGVRFQF